MLSRVMLLIVGTGLFVALLEGDNRHAARVRASVAKRVPHPTAPAVAGRRGPVAPRLPDTRVHAMANHRSTRSETLNPEPIKIDVARAEMRRVASIRSEVAPTEAIRSASQTSVTLVDGQKSQAVWTMNNCPVPLPEEIAPGMYRVVDNFGSAGVLHVTREELEQLGLAEKTVSKDLYTRSFGSRVAYFVRQLQDVALQNSSSNVTPRQFR